jgi:hypothetical protein
MPHPFAAAKDAFFVRLDFEFLLELSASRCFLILSNNAEACS